MTVPFASRLPLCNAKDLDEIRVRKQNRNPNVSRRRKIVAIDTETHDGNIFLIADSDGHVLDYPNVNIDNVLKFLFKHEGKWIFFYNLRFDATCILKLLPERNLKSCKLGNGMEFGYNGYKFRYIEKKLLSISHGNHTVSCFDIAQFYDNKRLHMAYVDPIRKLVDNDYLEMKNSRSTFTLRYYRRHKKRVRKYCIRDCIITKELAEEWVDTFEKATGFCPARWISSGYLAEKVLVFNNIPVPCFHEMPYQVQRLAWKSFYGGRFELIKRGYIGKCYIYDLNSAYPYALTKIPDLINGKWRSQKTIHPKAAIGFFHIRAYVNPNVGILIAPFPFRTKTGMIVYPVGDFETFVTLDELKSVEGDSRVKYEILDSQQFIPNANCTFPFKKFIEEQYGLRLELREVGDSREKALKVILNSMYGKMAQRVNNRIGNLFSPAIAAAITGHARAQLYTFCRDNGLESDIVAFATDSVACNRKIEGLDSKALGEMKLDKEGDDGIFVSNGYYKLGGKWKQRGVGYDRSKKLEIEHLDTRVGEDGKLYIAVKTTKTTHIRSAIKYNKLGQMGKIEKYDKHIDLNSDKKRIWLTDLKSLRDGSSCDSIPLNMDQVGSILAKEPEIDWSDENEEYYLPESEL
jgi:hypothetical protein